MSQPTASEPVGSDPPASVREAFSSEALREAMTYERPVFANPWDSPGDMFACLIAVSVIEPALLWLGGKLMAAIFGFGSHWSLGVFIAAAVVGTAGFMTIVGRQRTRLAVDVLAIGIWFVLGLIIAPIVGLAPPALVAVILYAVMLAGIFGYVVVIGKFATAFVRTLSWPIVWSLLAAGFAFSAYRLLLFS